MLKRQDGCIQDLLDQRHELREVIKDLGSLTPEKKKPKSLPGRRIPKPAYSDSDWDSESENEKQEKRPQSIPVEVVGEVAPGPLNNGW